jgi:hypothetical protein
MKAGNKVVCIDPVGDLIKGKIYIIRDLKECLKCNALELDVGICLVYGFLYRQRCPKCGHYEEGFIGGGKHWFNASRFRPLQYDTCHDELINIVEEKPDIKIKEPVL